MKTCRGCTNFSIMGVLHWWRCKERLWRKNNGDEQIVYVSQNEIEHDRRTGQVLSWRPSHRSVYDMAEYCHMFDPVDDNTPVEAGIAV